VRAIEPSEYLTIADVMARFHASRMWVARRTLDANFPKPVRFGPGVSAVRRWRRTDIEAWEAARAAQEVATPAEPLRGSSKMLTNAPPIVPAVQS